MGRRVLHLLSLLGYALAQGHVTDYAPQTNVQCPNTSTDPLLRVFTPQTQALHPQEIAYINTRESTVIPGAWQNWLGDGSGIGYNLSTFSANFPRIGIAASGGGLRASQYGAAVLNALDSRNATAYTAGTGGLLQVSSYLAALSGGAWLTGSLYMNDWPLIPDLVLGNGGNLSGWILDRSLIIPNGVDVFDPYNQAFYGSLIWSIEAKANKSIDTSITDPWSRMVSYHFLNQTTRSNFFTNDTAHGAGQLWSQVTQTTPYQQFSVPFPIIYADSRPVESNSTTILSLQSTVYEMTPLEFGSWDPNLSAMVNMTFAGTQLTNGQPPNSTGCVTGFDQVGFVLGTSASLFNQALDQATNQLAAFSDSDAHALFYVIAWQFRQVRTRVNDVALWPNPFNNIKPETFQDSSSDRLELIDGNSNQENIPLTPLFVTARGLDVIVAIDSSTDDTFGWQNGTSFLFTSERLNTVLQSSHQPFPPIPHSFDSFIATGVRFRPTFFGCDPHQNPPEYPLLISLPNSPPFNGDVPVTNPSTRKLTYTLPHTRRFLDQAFVNTISGFTPNANTADPNWGRCLQCAAIDRARYKLKPVLPRSAFCSQCFQQYCYDPQNPPSQSELPNRKLDFVDPDPEGLDQVVDFIAKDKYKLVGGLIGLAAFVGLMIFGLLWWRKRKEARARYQKISDLHEDDVTFSQYTDHNGETSYVLQSYS